MKKYTIFCVDRNTGKECVEEIVAENESEAFNQIADLGKMVYKLHKIEDINTFEGTAIPNNNFQRTNEAELKTDNLDNYNYFLFSKPTPLVLSVCIMILGFFIQIGGFFDMRYAMNMDTTYGDTHNIGLLNKQTIHMIRASVTVLSGFMILAAGIIGGFLHFAGRLVCLELQKFTRIGEKNNE